MLFPLLFPLIASANPVFDLPKGDLPRGELWFVSEIAEGTHKKFELRTSTGAFFLDRELCPRKVLGGGGGTDRTVHDYPTSYGISPGRFNVDRDPLDLIVLGSAKEYQSLAAKGKIKPRLVHVIGMMKFDECDSVPCTEEKQWKQDWKVFAVDKADKAFAKVSDMADLSPADVARVTEFYANYKGPKKTVADGVEHPQTRVTGFLGRDSALALVARDFALMDKKKRAKEVRGCERKFAAVLSGEAPVTLDDAYLNCLQRVRNHHALPGAASFEKFLSFNAVQRALSLGEAEVTLENAVAKLEARKASGKTYYRFVGHDRPSPPGTGQAIYEWVETKDRNKGCPEGTPAQHYEARPLVDKE